MGFGELLDNKPSGAARIAYAYIGNFAAGVVMGAVIQTGAGTSARNLPFKNAELAKRVANTLDDIAQGTPRFRQDGTIFENRKLPLPQAPQGYYREWVVSPAGGVTGPGKERIVIGGAGEVYYTPNHYANFVRIE